MNKLIVSLSPHVHGGDSVQKNVTVGEFLIGTMPVCLTVFMVV